MKSFPRFGFFAFVALTLASELSGQTVIPVQNASFESPALAPDSFSNGATFWTDTGGGGGNSGALSGSLANIPDGSQALFINSQYVYQNLGYNIVAGVTYTLSGWGGQRTNDTTVTEQFSLYTASGTFLATSGVLSPATGNFVFASISYTGTGGTAGQELQIRLEQVTGQGIFDQIQVTAVPEPATWALFGGVTALSVAWWRRRALGHHTQAIRLP